MDGVTTDDAVGDEAGKAFHSEWTVPRSGVDFSGFRIPTQDDAPWGADDVVHWISVTVDVGTSRGPQVTRGAQPVTFDPQTRMLVRRGDHADKPGTFWLGLRALVNLRVERRQWGGAGKPRVTAFGRCYDGDQARLEALAVAEVERDVRGCMEACRTELVGFRRASAEGAATA